MAASAIALVTNTVPTKSQFAPRAIVEGKPDNVRTWTRSEVLALACQSCTTCRGSGLRFGRRNELKPCECVLRAICRIVIDRARWHRSLESSNIIMLMQPPKTAVRRPTTWGFKKREFRADVELCIRRTLNAQDLKIHRLQLSGWDAKAIAAKVELSVGNVRHRIYAIQERLGLAFAEMLPYALYPTDEYFSGKAKLHRTPPSIKAAA